MDQAKPGRDRVWEDREGYDWHIIKKELEQGLEGQGFKITRRIGDSNMNKCMWLGFEYVWVAGRDKGIKKTRTSSI